MNKDIAQFANVQVGRVENAARQPILLGLTQLTVQAALSVVLFRLSRARPEKFTPYTFARAHADLAIEAVNNVLPLDASPTFEAHPLPIINGECHINCRNPRARLRGVVFFSRVSSSVTEKSVSGLGVPIEYL